MKHLITLIFVAATLTGCATHEPLTREEWLANSTRHYPDHTPEEVIAAAEQILRKRGGKRFKIAHDKNGFAASFNWFFLTASGTDYWRIDAIKNENGGTDTAMAVARSGSVMAATGGANVTNLPLGSAPIAGTAVYNLWFARMDNLLTGSPEWRKCPEQQELVRSDPAIWGGLQTLCV